MTRAVQHVGVPGVSVAGIGPLGRALFFGPQLREHSAVSQEVESLGDNLLDVSVGFGESMSFLRRRGLGNSQIRQSLDRGRLPIPHVETREGDLVWNEPSSRIFWAGIWKKE